MAEQAYSSAYPSSTSFTLHQHRQLAASYVHYVVFMNHGKHQFPALLAKKKIKKYSSEKALRLIKNNYTCVFNIKQVSKVKNQSKYKINVA